VLIAGMDRAAWVIAERWSPSAERSGGEPGRRDWTTIRITKGKSFATSVHFTISALAAHG
jgi:hypothetical protein